MALTGQQVASTNATGALRPLDLLVTALNGAIDIEKAKILQPIGDAATVNRQGIAETPTQAPAQAATTASHPLLDTLKGLTPLQYGGLALAGLLGYLLVTGHFR